MTAVSYLLILTFIIIVTIVIILTSVLLFFFPLEERWGSQVGEGEG